MSRAQEAAARRVLVGRAQTEANSPKEALMRLSDLLRYGGAVRESEGLDRVICRLEYWQRRAPR